MVSPEVKSGWVSRLTSIFPKAEKEKGYLGKTDGDARELQARVASPGEPVEWRFCGGKTIIFKLDDI